MRNSKGFTLVEIIVAVALVAILSAAIAPSVLNNIAQGRVSRASSDVQAIAQAVMRFKNDTGYFPNLVFPSNTDSDSASQKFDYLASVEGDFAAAASGVNWPGAAATFSEGASTDGSTQDITSHLILGKARGSTDSLYTRAEKPEDPASIGFRGGLLNADPQDPWRHKYVCNVAGLGWSGQAIWVISAGPNGIIETNIALNGTGAAQSLTGDDIGFRIQ